MTQDVAALFIKADAVDADAHCSKTRDARNAHEPWVSNLLNQHRRSIFNVARRILKDDSEAEDIVQEVSLLIYQRAHLFDPNKSSMVSWIIQIAYHRAIDRRRYLTHRQHYNRPELVEDLTPSRRPTALDALTARNLLEKLRNELSNEQMQTLELHFFEGLSFKEIAEKTGQSYGNVRNHYYRGIERLRTHIFPQKQR
jgi:RNA polymerase sigma-70 factor (ECF subfamily)